MDKTAFFTMPSGLYVVSSAADGLRAGCVINTAVQVTSMPPRISVAVDKDNVTSGVIASAKAFALTVIDQTADMLYIGNFGFRTSSDYDKFAKYETRETALGMPYVPEHAAALFSCRLIDTVDVGTHLLFIGEVGCRAPERRDAAHLRLLPQGPKGQDTAQSIFVSGIEMF